MNGRDEAKWHPYGCGCGDPEHPESWRLGVVAVVLDGCGDCEERRENRVVDQADEWNMAGTGRRQK